MTEKNTLKHLKAVKKQKIALNVHKYIPKHSKSLQRQAENS